MTSGGSSNKIKILIAVPFLLSQSCYYLCGPLRFCSLIVTRDLCMSDSVTTRCCMIYSQCVVSRGLSFLVTLSPKPQAHQEPSR